MLKADRRFWREMPVAIVWLGIVAVIIGSVVSRSVLNGPSFLDILGALFIAALSSFFFSGEILRPVKSVRRLRRGEQRRQAAVTGSQMVLVTWPQPVPSPVALPLPFSIWFRPKGLTYALLSLFAVFVIVYWVLQAWWYYYFPDAPVLFGVVLGLLYSVSSLLSLHQWIELSEEGMTVRSPFRSKTICWQEARLFAIDVLAKGNQPADRFELSSETTIVRWSRKLKPSRLTRLSSPFPEYAWQMEALLSLIAGRTGLHLYDLRDGVTLVMPVSPALVVNALPSEQVWPANVSMTPAASPLAAPAPVLQE